MRTRLKSVTLGFFLGVLFATVGFGVYLKVARVRDSSAFDVEIKRALSPPDLPWESPDVSIDSTRDWQLKNADGHRTKLSDFKGKVILLHLWATWCTSCLPELSELEQLHDSLIHEDVVFLLVTNESMPVLQGFLRNKRVIGLYYRADESPPEVLHTIGIPTTFVITQDGRTRMRQVGPALWNQSNVVNYFRKLCRAGLKGGEVQ
jgi:thiol-disulfide isomerase/thioredoxin